MLFKTTHSMNIKSNRTQEKTIYYHLIKSNGKLSIITSENFSVNDVKNSIIASSDAKYVTREKGTILRTGKDSMGNKQINKNK